MNNISQNNIKRFGVIWIFAWTLTLSLLFLAIVSIHHLDTMESPMHLAKDYYALNMEYRKWNAQLGGVYAESNKVTPNPHLNGQHRDIVATDGTKLTLINDAYMSQMVFESISRNSENPIISKLVSLDPLNPRNSADPWEKKALDQFVATTVREVHQEGTIDGRFYLRQIHAFVAEESCLKCHLQHKPDLKIGDIIGGMSISIPLARDLDSERRTDSIAFFCFTFLLIVGSLSIAFAQNKRFKYEESLVQRTTLAQDLLSRYAIVSDGIPFLIAHVDKDERYIFANKAYADWIGIPQEQIHGHTVQEILGEKVYSASKVYIKDALKGTQGEVERVVTNAEDLEEIQLVSFVPQRNSENDVVAYFALINNITERKRAENKLRLMAKVFERSGEAIIITGPDKKILATNDTFTSLTGYSQEEVLGQNPSILKSGRESKDFYKVMWESLLRHNYWHGEIWNRCKNGEVYPKWLTITVVRDNRGDITNYIGSFVDITERMEAKQKIEYLAYRDTLTNLYNRSSLMESLTLVLEMSKRSDEHMALLFIDLDNFKVINDSLGHPIGDMLLYQVAARLLESVRNADIVARLGGDEFVIVLPQIQSGVSVAPIVGKLQHALSQPYIIDGYTLYATASIGISIFPHDGETVEELMKNSDVALYHAKSEGRNNYQFFKQEMNSNARERLLMEHDLRLAVENEEFILHYQPQIDVITGQMIGVEALVRWQHPNLGLVFPDSFIGVAESTGLILPIGKFVLETACRQLKAWQAEGLPQIRMAVNLSALQFKQSDLPFMVEKIITETGIDPHLLELEITESVAMDNPDAAILHLNKFREMGVELAIDDFGTGYSSLSYLKLFPVHRLKIDRSFVKDLETDSDDAAIASATIALAHSLGKNVVAEGVETEFQLSYLRSQQCDIVQGYYYSRPMPVAELAAFLRNRIH